MTSATTYLPGDRSLSSCVRLPLGCPVFPPFDLPGNLNNSKTSNFLQATRGFCTLRLLLARLVRGTKVPQGEAG